MKFKPLNSENCLDTAFAKSFDEGFKQGFAQGFAEGERQSKITISKKLKALNIAIDIIAIATGLTVDEIKQLD